MATDSLDDNYVISIRRAVRENPKLNAKFFAERDGRSVHTISKAILGVTHKRLNHIEAPFVKPSRKISIKTIVDLRQRINKGEKVNLLAEAEKIGCSENAVRKAIIGHNSKEADVIVPPVTLTGNCKKGAKEKARVLFSEGKNYNEIVDILKVAKSSVSIWCSDLRKARDEKRLAEKTEEERKRAEDKILEKQRKRSEAEIKRKETVAERKARRGQPCYANREMTMEDVAEMRRDVRRNQCRNVSFYADKFGVSETSISMAQRGVTFKDADALEPPVLEKFTKESAYAKLTKERDERAQEALTLFRSDPVKWSYAALAEYLTQKYGVALRPCIVKRLMVVRDPSIAALEPPKVAKPKVARAPKIERERRVRASGTKKKKVVQKPTLVIHKHECVWCGEEFESSSATLEFCTQDCRESSEAYYLGQEVLEDA